MAGQVSPGCISFGAVLPRLFIPTDARLHPSASEEELKSVFGGQLTYVWHPAAGLVALEPGDQLSVAQLLAPPRGVEKRWDFAVPGVALSVRLRSLQPQQTLSWEMVFKAAGDDIGADADSPEQLPPSPDEPPSGPMHDVSRAGRRALAKLARWLAGASRQGPQAKKASDSQRSGAASPGPNPGRGRSGATPSGFAPSGAGGLMGWLGQWAEKTLSQVPSQVQASREREIARLMNLLETDPDQGLRYALPVGGGSAHRGQAPPSGRLGKRDPQFKLGRVGRSGRADYWDLPAETHYQLAARYRELANRELRLGRYRRAAYIYAELLGDLALAASALCAGGYYREAAVIYRQRLHRPQEAARCLEQGGLWSEAIELYQQLHEYEKAGDLCVLIDQQDDARRFFTLAVERHLSQGDRLAAAEVLQKKQANPTAALEILQAGWPLSQQAGQCLQAIFRLCGQQGWHQTATDWVQGFRDRTIVQGISEDVADILAQVATTYPDASLRTLAADTTRVVVARRLPSTTDPQRVISALTKLTPEDRLLRRDCHRYLQRRTEAARQKAGRSRAARSSGPLKPVLIKTMALPRQVIWETAISGGPLLFAAGVCSRGPRVGRLAVICGTWEHGFDTSYPVWQVTPGQPTPPILLAISPLGGSQLLVHLARGRPLERYRFPETDRRSQVVGGGMSGLTASVVAAAQMHYGITWLVDSNDDASEADCPFLVGLGSAGTPLRTHDIPVKPEERALDGGMISLCASNSQVYVGWGRKLSIFPSHLPEGCEEEIYEQEIREVVATPPHGPGRLAVAFAEGGLMYWGQLGRHCLSQPFGLGMEDPQLCLTLGGHLVVACPQECEVYRTTHQRLSLQATLPCQGFTPKKVLRAPQSHRFAILTTEGELRVYQIP